jgi:hypothetical protein
VTGPNPKDLAGRSKPDLSLCTGPMLAALAAGLADGARKYGRCNWRVISVEARTYCAAATRHLKQWEDGEESAQDSGVHHLDHAIATLAILRDAMACGTLIDNRAPTGPMPGATTRVFAEHQAREFARLQPSPEQPALAWRIERWSVAAEAWVRSNDMPETYSDRAEAERVLAAHDMRDGIMQYRTAPV